MDDDVPEGMVVCEFCEGVFLPEDMEGEHCRDCVVELFGDEA